MTALRPSSGDNIYTAERPGRATPRHATPGTPGTLAQGPRTAGTFTRELVQLLYGYRDVRYYNGYVDIDIFVSFFFTQIMMILPVSCNILI